MLMESEQLTLFSSQTLASLTVLPGTEKARKMTVSSGRKLTALWKRSDPAGLCVKMCAEMSHWDSTVCLLTWTTLDTPGGGLVIPACGIGAFHKRERLFVVAHIDGIGMEGCPTEQILGKLNIQIGQVGKPFQDAERRYDTFESRLCRSLHGLPHGVDRVRALGNTIVPQQIYPILAAIKMIDDYLRVNHK